MQVVMEFCTRCKLIRIAFFVTPPPSGATTHTSMSELSVEIAYKRACAYCQSTA